MIGAKPYKIEKALVAEAFRRVKANRGAAGVDKQSLCQFEEHLDDNLYLIWNRMSSGCYFPPAVRAVSIPKKDGGERILGVPTVGDRVAQMVVKMLIEAQLEKVFDADSYGFRPGRSAHQALSITRQRCWKYDWVLEFDIRKLFDRIDHDLLMKAVRHHVTVQWQLLYIDRWLKAPMSHADGRIEQRSKGTPQGGVLSPLLANLFMHYAFDVWMRRKHPGVPFCRYADDGLIHCRTLEEAQRLQESLSARMQECALELHSEKTSIVYCADNKRRQKYGIIQFTFLGYTFRPRQCRDRFGTVFYGFNPAISRTAELAVRKKIRKWRLRSKTFMSLAEIARKVSPFIRGWMNYYCAFYQSQFQSLGAYINAALVNWAMRKYKHLNKRKVKAIHWLNRVIRSNSRLFPHWGAGLM